MCRRALQNKLIWRAGHCVIIIVHPYAHVPILLQHDFHCAKVLLLLYYSEQEHKAKAVNVKAFPIILGVVGCKVLHVTFTL